MQAHFLARYARLLPIFALLIFASLPAFAQSSPATVRICVREMRGTPLETAVMVRLHAVASGYDVRNPTQEGSTASFPGVKDGEYEIEIKALGFKPVAEFITVESLGRDSTFYIYLQRESNDSAENAPPNGFVMSPKLQHEMDKGLQAMKEQQYEQAKAHFVKASQLAPANADLIYLLGTAELALNHPDLARNQFEGALKLDPSNERALMALGELHLQAGDLPSAITILEKAFNVNGQDWRVHSLLATAYARSGRLAEAEKHAALGVTLAKEKGANLLYLLGEIQFAEHKTTEARETWQRFVSQFPSDPLVPKAKNKLASTANSPKELSK